MKTLKFLIIFILSISALLFTYKAIAGKLYIKPDLEMKRAARLLKEADQDFRMAKVHLELSPAIARKEFEHAQKRYSQIIDIIQLYGAGYYTPGDIMDFETRIDECSLWIRKADENIRRKSGTGARKTLSVF